MGYAGVKFVSETIIWTRAPADLQRCGSKPAEAPFEPATATTAEEKDAPAEKSATAATLPSQTTGLPSSQEIKATSDTAAVHGKQKDCTVRFPYVVITIPCID
jgi:hypothetical protein